MSLLRHGQASPSGPAGDASRPLTPHGRRTLRALAAQLTRDAWSPERVYTSPLVRARDSALILLGGLGVTPPIVLLNELEPERPAHLLLVAIGDAGGLEGEVLVVGHQPQLGRVVAYLTGQDREFAPGELIRIDFDGECLRGVGRIGLNVRPDDPPLPV